MLIASKYEEIWAPEVRDFVYISDKAYNREQILGMEKLMLNTLHFNLTLPTSFNFLSRCLKAAGCQFDKQVNMYAGYLAELALVENSMLKHPYSQVSQAPGPAPTAQAACRRACWRGELANTYVLELSRRQQDQAAVAGGNADAYVWAGFDMRATIAWKTH